MAFFVLWIFFLLLSISMVFVFPFFDKKRERFYSLCSRFLAGLSVVLCVIWIFLMSEITKEKNWLIDEYKTITYVLVKTNFENSTSIDYRIFEYNLTYDRFEKKIKYYKLYGMVNSRELRAVKRIDQIN